MRSLDRNAVSLSLVGAPAPAPAVSSVPAAMPAVHHLDGVEYLSGGMTRRESRAIARASRHWPLTMAFAVSHGRRTKFAMDVAVIVRDARGHPILQALASGPLLLARLSPGHYGVRATFAGRTLSKDIEVRAGRAFRVVFLWPEGSDMALD
jgi:hypothetical protein